MCDFSGIVYDFERNAVRLQAESRTTSSGIVCAFKRIRVRLQADSCTTCSGIRIPGTFGSIQDSRVFGGPFFDWYNNPKFRSDLSVIFP